MRSLVGSVVALGLLAACGDLPHDNPHDPQTPTDNQARATLVGKVSLEPAGATAPAASGIHVSVAGHSWAADTDADGSYAISGVPVGVWTVQFTRPGWDDDAIAGITITLDDGGKELALPDVLLHVSRGNVAGKVALEDETTAGGVAVTLSGGAAAIAAGSLGAAAGGYEASAFTDAAGNFLLTGVPVGTYALDASKVGFHAGAIATVVVTASSVTLLEDLLLQVNPGAFQGQILVSGAATSGGVTVRASGVTLNGSPWESTTVDRADGSYLFSGLPGGTYTVSFELAGYGTVTTSGAVVPGQITDLGPVTLQRDTGSAFGVARLEGTADFSGIQVALRPDLSSPAAATALTDASGAWRLDGVPVGTYAVTYLRQPGWAQATSSITIASHAVTQAADALLAAIPGVLRGRVLLEGVAAGALAATTVRVEGTNLSTATLADGTWVLTGVGSGNQTVVYERSGFDAQRVQVVTVPAGDLTLSDATLAVSRGGVGGTFLLQGMAASAGVVVSAAGPASASTVTDASGAFTLGSLPVGTYTLTARSDPDWQPATVAGVVVSAGTSSPLPGGPRTLLPVSTASLAGTILLERPADASGTTVTVTGQDFRGGAVSRTAVTGSNGAWTLGGLLAGSYQVTCSHPGYDPCPAMGLAVPSGAAVAVSGTTLAVSLGSIGGSVALSAGAVTGFPVGADRSGVVVTLSGADVPVPAAVTDASGSYRFDGVPVSLGGGSYSITARRASYQVGGPVTVTAVAGATATAPPITLVLDPGALSGTVQLWDNVANAGVNATSAGATVTVTGTAFNGAAWTASTTTGATGAFTVPSLPQGSYDVVATSAGRTCAPFGRASVSQGATAAAGTVRCTDALAPGAVTLGTPPPPAGAQAGYTNVTAVAVPVSVAATDPTVPASNLRGYQTAVGLAPDWTAAPITAAPAASLAFTIGRNARTVLWARAVDWVGNPGPVASVEIVEDDVPPPAPQIATPRAIVNATTSSVTLSGSEGDASFLGYQTCTTAIAVTGTETCPAAPACTFASSAASFAVSLTASQKTCVYARAVDRAGNVSPVAMAGITSDLTAPTPPTFAPSYDPYQLTVRAPWVDFFQTAAATDQPGSGAPWAGIAYIEVDTGAGYQPLCPQAACQVSGAWSPCACSCADARLRCDGTRFVGVRAPLSEGTATTVAFRAVDLAGNTGAGVSQQVFAEATSDVVASSAASDLYPSVRGTLVGFEEYVPAVSTHGVLVDLGTNRRADAGDARCTVTTNSSTALGVPVFPVSEGLVVFSDNMVTARALRPGADGAWCTGDDVSTALHTYASGWVDGVVGGGETAAWVHRIDNAHFDLVVKQPASGQLAAGSPEYTVYSTAAAGTAAASRLTMGGKSILLQACGLSTACNTYAWRLYVAGASGSFGAGVTAWDLPAGAAVPALSSDGLAIAWLQGGSLTIRAAGPDRRLGTGDDLTYTAAVPPGVSVSELALDGLHLAATATYGGQAVVLHWWAGPDGVWGNADDVLGTLRPSSANRWNPSLQGGLLVFEQAQDLHALDLTAMRWEVAPSTSPASALAVDGNGMLFYDAGALYARALTGAQTSTGDSSVFGATGSDLLVGSGGVVDFTVDGTGAYFNTPGLRLYSTSSWVSAVGAGGGKGIVLEVSYASSPPAAAYHILEPGAGSLHTSVDAYDPSAPAVANGNWAVPPAITSRQAFYTCPTMSTDLCVYGAGTDGVFHTGDDVAATRLTHAPGSPLAGAIVDWPNVVASDQLMLFSEQAGSTYLRDPGPNGLFDGVDDRERAVVPRRLYPGTMAVAGSWAAWIDAGAGGGDQVFVVNGYDGTVMQVTNHYSQKSGLAIDAHGRTYWIDDVMTPAAVMVFIP